MSDGEKPAMDIRKTANSRPVAVTSSKGGLSRIVIVSLLK